ncbi:hypothetical protein FPQ18DRAFT_330453 [Pyronema domesticum]|nr:hypothetical protein FPQ18DRAFT_330453 [Pyronema domesticum]
MSEGSNQSQTKTPPMSPESKPKGQRQKDVDDSGRFGRKQSDKKIEATQIRTVLETFMSKEKTGLNRFYKDENLPEELVMRATTMASELIDLGCTRELAQSLAILNLYDLAILLDDSLSMVTEEEGKRLSALETTLEIVAQVYTLTREDGIGTIDFLNEPDGFADVVDTEIAEIIKDHSYSGWTRIGTELEAKILNELVTDDMKKPLLVLVITDGDIEGERDGVIASVIGKCIKDQQTKFPNHAAHAVAFQFAKVGNDIGAENLLEAIDNHKVIGDYVDRLPVGIEAISDLALKWEVLAKMLLGGIVRSVGSNFY